MGDLALPIRSRSELALRARLSSDERLARLVSRGNAGAFAVLYRRHHQVLYRYCRSIVRDEDDAQDALQSAMTRALAALQAGERDLAVRPWLFRIAHNEAVSLLRRRRPNASLDERLERADGAIERTLEQRERFAALVADLQSLPERQRAALVMRELSGLPIKEIAAALSTSPGAAKQAVFEARCALHEFEEGRAMECEDVRRAISDGDGRVLRGRKIRAHLRECRGCRDFELMIGARTGDLRALAPPLPAATATVMLARLLAHGTGGGHAGGAAAASGAAFGNHAAVSLTVKALAGVAIAAAATAGSLQLASRPHRHRPSSPPVRRSTPLSGGAVGEGAGVHRAVRTSAPQPLRRGLKASHAVITTNGRTPPAVQTTPAGAATPIGAQRAGAGGGSRTRPENPRHGSRQSSHSGYEHRSSKRLHPAPRQQTVREEKGQTPAPAREHPRGHGGPDTSTQATPGTESRPSFSPKTTLAG
jgi:RNA polymerase sigma factor (sigma-70 family)